VITVIIKYQAQPGKAAVARDELAALVATVVAQEPACLGIGLHQDLNDETQFLLYERWTDQAAYLGPHMQTPHLQAFIARAPGFLSGPPDISFWSQVADEQRR
jgi:quinol monooxygenase YgiN